METQRAVVKSRTGRNTGHRTKQLFFFLAAIAIASISSIAATDILFLVDSTGSMGGLSTFKTAFNDIITAIEADSCPEYIMYGVADYRNRSDGGNYTAYGVNLDQPFTNSAQDTQSVINGLSAGGGEDAPESQLKAMISITNNWLTTSGDLGFNGRPGAQRILIWAGDDPGHDAADDSYYPTLDAVINSLTAQGIIVFALNPSGYHSGLDGEYHGHYQASEITDATEGELFNNVQSATSAIKDAIINKIKCFTFEKDDDLDDENPTDCRQDGQEIEYTISWTNTSGQALTNAWILDKLPAGVTYPVEYTFDPNTWEMTSSDPNYDPENHEYVWFIGPIPVDASGSVSLTVVVNSDAVPGMNLINTAELYDDEILATISEKKTLICCPENPLSTICVDESATGANSGLNWQNAYTSLDDALIQARESVCVTNFTILVAEGTYTPQDTENGFVLPDNVSVYGGFPKGGCDFAYRNPKKYETILTGLIDEVTIAEIGITMGDGTLLDGFTITNAFDFNIYSSGVDFTLAHCTITECLFGSGVYAENGNVVVQWCTININSTTGLYHEGKEYTLTVDNSWVMRNGEYGIYTVDSTLDIKNSIISESDMVEQGRQGIRIENPTYQPILYNCTIANNKAAGIYFEDSNDVSGDPNNLDYPDLHNSIVYYNNNGGPQLTGFKADLHANFCCIQDCNELDTTNFNDEPGFAYAVDPMGTPDPNNYHLSANSVCIDQANPFLSYTNQVDIDGEGLDRQYGSAVDVGADEVYDCYDDYLSEADVYNALDWDADGLVNLKEFTAFSSAWLTYDPNHPYCDPGSPYYVSDPNAPGYISELDKERFNSKCDLDSDLDVDLDDVLIFVEDTPWLWIACWKLEEINAAEMAMQSQAQSQSMMFESMAVESSLSITSSEAPAQEPSLESSAMTEEAIEEEQAVSAETLVEIISFLDEILLTETDNIEGIMELKALLQEELDALLSTQSQ